MVRDVLLLSYLDKIGLSLTDEAGQASACLYSEARLYKGPSLAPLSQSTTTRSTGNISVGVKKVGHCNKHGTVSSSSSTVKKKLPSIMFISTANEHILTESWLQIVEIAIISVGMSVQ